MKSSSNQYFIGLDHIRALAAYLVFCWHFLHWSKGSPIPFSYDAYVPFLSLVNEGHIGVSIFMVLSGYLFAKILNNKKNQLPNVLSQPLFTISPVDDLCGAA